MSLRAAAGPFFGEFGGRYMPESLIAAIDELTEVYESAKADPDFQEEFLALLRATAQPETSLRFSSDAGISIFNGLPSHMPIVSVSLTVLR